MAKRRVDLLLDEDLVARVEAERERLRWSRTTLVVAALEGFLDGAGRGVPDRPRERRVAAPEVRVPKPRGVQQAVEAARGAVAPASDPRWERQRRLNEEKERSS